MKTNMIALKTDSLLPFILAALMFLATTGCEKEQPLYYGDSIEAEAQYNGNILNESFWVQPEGSDLELLGGAVTMTFPEGAVSVPSQFTLVSFPIHHLDLDGFNMYNRGFSLEGPAINQRFANGIMFRVTYDMSGGSWKKSVPVDEQNLTIYYVSPTLYAYERITPIGPCCIDGDCKIIKGCIGQCGFYVVGEN